MRFLFGDDDGPATPRTEGIGYGGLAILMVVFWLAIGALDREIAQDIAQDAARQAQTER